MDVYKVARGTTVIFLSTFIGLGLNYIYGVFLARWFGASDFGVYSLGLSIFGILSVLSVMGLDNAALRFVPRVSDGERMQLFDKLFLLGLCVSVIVFFVIYSATSLIAINLYNSYRLADILVFFALAIPSYSASSICLSFLQSVHDVQVRMVIKYIVEPVLKVLLTIAFILLGYKLEGAVISFLIASWSILALGFIAVKARGGKCEDEKKVSIRYGDIISYSVPIVIGMVFTIVSSKSDFIILGYLVSSVQLGIYAAALQTSAITAIVLQSVESILIPYISEAVNSLDIARLKTLYHLSLRMAYVIAMPLFLVFILYPMDVLRLFGNEFVSAEMCLILLAIGQFLNIATGSANAVLLMLSKTKVVMINSILNGCALVGMNLILIPKYGIIGAAVSMLISTLFVNLLRLSEVYFFLKILPYSMMLVRPTVVALFVFAFFYALSCYYFPGNGLFVIPFIFITYFLLIIFFGLAKKERAQFFHLFKKKLMLVD